MLQIVIVYMGLYEHWALVSDKFSGGKPMLISNTWRNGTVQEESWDQVVGSKPFKLHQVRTTTQAGFVLARARSAIGRVKYNLLQYNCEHFVREVISGVAKSKQIKKVAIMGGITLGAIYLLSKKR
ncbi:MAG: lecithin retinol acyltransferase family protein [Thiotrichales bacterium]|nr:lecithin retinol acyltransferase family protein [Thiotrichales bacterium]